MDQSRASQLARQLLKFHGLDGWEVRFDRARTRAGSCRYRERVITLSAPLTRLYNDDDVRTVVLHEIAHALVGEGHGHDAVWKNTAKRIGIVPAATLRGTPQVDAPWVGTCPNGHVVRRFRRPTRQYSCTRCDTSFNLAFLFSWRRQ